MLGHRRRPVVRMHQIDERLRAQLLARVAQRALPGAIDADETTVEVHGRKQIERAFEVVRQDPLEPAPMFHEGADEHRQEEPRRDPAQIREDGHGGVFVFETPEHHKRRPDRGAHQPSWNAEPERQQDDREREQDVGGIHRASAVDKADHGDRKVQRDRRHNRGRAAQPRWPDERRRMREPSDAHTFDIDTPSG